MTGLACGDGVCAPACTPGYSRVPGAIAQVVPRMTAVGQELPVEVVTVNGRISAETDARLLSNAHRFEQLFR